MKRNFKIAMLMGMITALTMMEPMIVMAAEQDEIESVIYLTEDLSGITHEIPITSEESYTEQNGNQYMMTKVIDVSIPTEESGINPCVQVEDAGKTVRITFTVKYTNSGSKYQFNGVSGSYKILDSAFSISNRHVMYTNQYNFSKGNIWEKYPSSNSFSYSGSSEWIDTKNDIEYWIGGYAECKISRGGSSWTLRATENVIKNVN